METIAYKDVQDIWAGLLGITIDEVTDQQRVRFNRFFNRAIRRGWNWYFWPVLMQPETRYFRDAWAVQAYAVDAEVWHAATAKYWRANDATLSTDVPGVSAKWDEITDIDAYVAYDQTGRTAFQHVKEIWTANPRKTRGACDVPWIYDERGVRLTGNNVPTSVWVNFRRPCPRWGGADFNAGVAYPTGQMRFYASTSTGCEGDFWTANATTAPGESPETTPAKWGKLEVPAFLGDFVANAAKILELEGDAGFEKALLAEGQAWAWLYDERDLVQSQSGNVRRARASNV